MTALPGSYSYPGESAVIGTYLNSVSFQDTLCVRPFQQLDILNPAFLRIEPTIEEKMQKLQERCDLLESENQHLKASLPQKDSLDQEMRLHHCQIHSLFERVSDIEDVILNNGEDSDTLD